jgi:hypothetical protein
MVGTRRLKPRGVAAALGSFTQCFRSVFGMVAEKSDDFSPRQSIGANASQIKRCALHEISGQ